MSDTGDATRLTEGEANYRAVADYKYKPNNSPKAKKIKNELEDKGHTNVFVWWEPIGGAPEMCGNEGGYFYCSDQETLYPLGYSFDDAMAQIERPWHTI